MLHEFNNERQPFEHSRFLARSQYAIDAELDQRLERAERLGDDVERAVESWRAAKRRPSSRDPLYRRHRFPPEVISYAVWLYLWTVPAMQGLLRQSGNARLQLSIRSLTQRRC
jgi:hypothetical protein